MINVTRRSVEETAAAIIQLTQPGTKVSNSGMQKDFSLPKGRLSGVTKPNSPEDAG